MGPRSRLPYPGHPFASIAPNARSSKEWARFAFLHYLIGYWVARPIVAWAPPWQRKTRCFISFFHATSTNWPGLTSIRPFYNSNILPYCLVFYKSIIFYLLLPCYQSTLLRSYHSTMSPLLHHSTILPFLQEQRV